MENYREFEMQERGLVHEEAGEANGVREKWPEKSGTTWAMVGNDR
jgi:hypothetical protein